ncbi:MAG: hypothetical protein RMI56_06095 [Sulfolobales archaeon]|nr:hypothetical protein [Sulfolobales archaeon]MDW8083348.1 hypothetical protein [Sulfolobales archaeon]
MDALTLIGILTAVSIAVSVVIWLPVALKAKVRRTEMYLSGEPQVNFNLGITEVSWAVRRVFEKLYSVVLNYVQTGVFNDWFAISLPYLLILLALLTVAIIVGGGV